MTVEPLFEVESLRELVVRLLHERCEAAEDRSSPAPSNWGNYVRALRRAASGPDERLVAIADRLGLEDFELLCAALCLAADDEPHVARIVSRAQDPIGGSRPLLGMLSAILRPLGATPLSIASGIAAQTGLFAIGDERASLAERSVGLALPVAAALAGHVLMPPGVEDLSVPPVALTEAQIERCTAESSWLAESDECRMLVLRTTSAREAAAIAARAGDTLGLLPAIIDGKAVAAQAAWLMAADILPCVQIAMGPGERLPTGSFGRYRGPILVLAGFDGSIDASVPVHEWPIEVPDQIEREALWIASGFDAVTAARAAAGYRQGAGRIAELAERTAETRDWASLVAAVAASPTRLDGLARRSSARVTRAELVLPDADLDQLDRLADRVRERNRLADGLGPAITARYRPGVRALFTGESGTGKTLAAHWLARETGLPLYRVDQAALTSKWIGETEKNLSTILDAASHADVVLFFDEADALFGARTDVRDSNDRHANAQTNYLLQRIEDHDGVIVLATNGRDRFDPAFVRRLDTILAFPMPDARARQAMWRVHLGETHTLTADEIGRLAVAIDLAGGHIRNIVLGGALRARLAERPIGFDDIVAGARDEYGKLGRALPGLAT